MQTTVILPTLNEEENIEKMIKEIRKQGEFSIIVADDGSTDKTIEIAKKNKAVVLDRSDEEIKGITASVIDAAKIAKTKNIIVMDCDFQHDVTKLKDIERLLKDNEVVIGRRVSLPKQWGLRRKLISKGATFLSHLRTVQNFKDPQSGFFGVKTDLLNKLDKNGFELRCFKALFNILKTIKPYQHKTGYVDYDFNLRNAGESKLSKKHIKFFLRSLLW